jgi:effector-binding domain-containing protein
MKALRILIIILVVLVAIYLVVPLFLPDNVIVNEEIEIDAKPATVFRQVNSLQNWLAWSPFEADKTMKNSFSGPEQGVGAKRKWTGEEAGAGSIEIIESLPYEYIRNQLTFGPGEGGGVGSWNFEKTDEGTEVTWTIHVQELSYPNYRWMGLLTETFLKPMMGEGLNKLKKLTEPMPDPPEIKVVDLAAQPTLLIPDSARLAGIDELLKRNFEKLYGYINYMKIPITGQHFAIYHNWDPDGIIRVSAGVPVEKNSKGFKEIKYFEIPATRAVFAKHAGGPSSAATHNAVAAYMKDFNLVAKDYIWETYLYDAAMQSDTTTWVTWIYYPLK